MRSAATWIVVGALLAIALVAAVDVLRGEAAPSNSASAETGGSAIRRSDYGPPTIDDRSALRTELEAAGINGTLYLTDHECRSWALELPELRWRSARSAPAPDCRLAVSPDARTLFGKAVWHPRADVTAGDDATVDHPLEAPIERGPIRELREIARPRDERFTLVATDSRIDVVRPGDPPIQIEVAAADVAWAEP